AAAVLPVDAGALQHRAAAELVVQALDERDRAPLFVHRAHPHGVARPFSVLCAFTPRRGPAPGHLRCELAHEAALEELARVYPHVARILEVAVAHDERL